MIQLYRQKSVYGASCLLNQLFFCLAVSSKITNKYSVGMCGGIPAKNYQMRGMYSNCLVGRNKLWISLVCLGMSQRNAMKCKTDSKCEIYQPWTFTVAFTAACCCHCGFHQVLNFWNEIRTMEQAMEQAYCQCHPCIHCNIWLGPTPLPLAQTTAIIDIGGKSNPLAVFPPIAPRQVAVSIVSQKMGRVHVDGRFTGVAFSDVSIEIVQR